MLYFLDSHLSPAGAAESSLPLLVFNCRSLLMDFVCHYNVAVMRSGDWSESLGKRIDWFVLGLNNLESLAVLPDDSFCDSFKPSRAKRITYLKLLGRMLEISRGRGPMVYVTFLNSYGRFSKVAARTVDAALYGALDLIERGL